MDTLSPNRKPYQKKPSKIPPRSQWQLIQEVTKDPRTTLKELQFSLASINIIQDSTIWKTSAKNCIYGRVTRRKPMLTQKQLKVLNLAKNTPWWSSNILRDCFVDWLVENRTHYIGINQTRKIKWSLQSNIVEGVS